MEWGQGQNGGRVGVVLSQCPPPKARDSVNSFDPSIIKEVACKSCLHRDTRVHEVPQGTPHHLWIQTQIDQNPENVHLIFTFFYLSRVHTSALASASVIGPHRFNFQTQVVIQATLNRTDRFMCVCVGGGGGKVLLFFAVFLSQRAGS